MVIKTKYGTMAECEEAITKGLNIPKHSRDRYYIYGKEQKLKELEDNYSNPQKVKRFLLYCVDRRFLEMKKMAKEVKQARIRRENYDKYLQHPIAHRDIVWGWGPAMSRAFHWVRNRAMLGLPTTPDHRKCRGGATLDDGRCLSCTYREMFHTGSYGKHDPKPERVRVG